MEPGLLEVFQEQLLLQCEYTMYAAADMNAAIDRQDVKRAFYAIQCLLTAAANASKALWGIKDTPPEQRKPLRDSIGVDDSSPLKSVRMRNHYEHFDEKIEAWWTTSRTRSRIDRNIMPRTALGGRLDDGDMFRNYDPITKELWFWTERFNVQDLVDEVQRLIPKLEAELAKVRGQ